MSKIVADTLSARAGGTITISDNINCTGIITGSSISGVPIQLTMGVRTGAAVTFSISGTSFTVYGRDTNKTINI